MNLHSLPAFSVLVNAQVCEQLLIKCPGRTSNVGHEKFYLSYGKAKNHSAAVGVGYKAKDTRYGQEVFPEVMRTWGVTTPDFASCSPSLWPFGVLGLSGERCVQTAALLPFTMRQATGEAAQIISQIPLLYQVSVSFPV